MAWSAFRSCSSALLGPKPPLMVSMRFRVVTTATQWGLLINVPPGPAPVSWRVAGLDQGILSDGILPSCLVAFLYGAPRQGLDCGCGITAFSSFIFLHPSFFVRLEKPVSSPRPTLDERRRAQDLSRTRTCAPVRALSLTGPSTAADLGKLGLRRATVSGSASCQATAKRPLNLISGRLEWEPNPYPTYWGRKRPGWTGTIFWPALKP